METYDYGIIFIMIVTMLWHPVLHGYNKRLYYMALTFWSLPTFGQTATSEHSTMASTLQFDQVIDASNINTVGDIIGTSLPHEVQCQARMEITPTPIQQWLTKPQELTEQFPTEWNSTIKAITQQDRCRKGRMPMHQVWSYRSLDPGVPNRMPTQSLPHYPLNPWSTFGARPPSSPYKWIRILVGTITEDGGTIKIPLMQCLTAWEASRNKYGCRTYTTTEALYIGTTSLQTNTDTCWYNYRRRWHHQNTFDAMPNSSRSKPQQVRMLYLYDKGSVVHGDNKPTNKYGYLLVQIRKTAAPSKYLWCNA